MRRRAGLTKPRVSLHTSFTFCKREEPKVEDEKETKEQKFGRKRKRVDDVEMINPSQGSDGFISASQILLEQPLSILTQPQLIMHVKENICIKKSLTNEELCTLEYPMRTAGFQRYRKALINTDFRTESTLYLVREKTNSYDSNAIMINFNRRYLTEEGENYDTIQIGYVPKEYAKYISPLLDDNKISFTLVKKDNGDEFYYVNILCQFQGPKDILLQLKEKLDNAPVEIKSKLTRATFSPSPSIENLEASKKAIQDPKMAKGFVNGSDKWNPKNNMFDVPLVNSDILSMEKYGIYDTNQKFIHLGWEPKDKNKLRLITEDERIEASGLGANNDAKFYGDFGLLPPDQLVVKHALKLKYDDPKIKYNSKQDEEMDGGLHSVSNIWIPSFLNEVTEMMGRDDFFLRHGQQYEKAKRDQLIGVIGAPYVLGQHCDRLKLIIPIPHNDLTIKLCQGKNMAHSIIHLGLPLAPGFNTLIFGLTCYGYGFHYHRDQVEKLINKNLFMEPRQPVNTTIIYQFPNVDSGKECVNWIPIDNEENLNASQSSYWPPTRDNVYLSKYSIVTHHGSEHIQKAGIQSVSKHGVFHTIGTEGRKGARVAITSRVAPVNSLEILKKTSHLFSEVVGGEREQKENVTFDWKS